MSNLPSPTHVINAPSVPEAERELNAELAKAQAEFPAIARSKTVTVKTQAGGSYSFSYAPLDAILSAVRPVLAAHGFALVQRLENPAGTPSLRTELRHAGGGVIAGSFPLGELPASPQQLGSLLTYLRRYAVTAILGIAAEEDDDGQQASERGAGAGETASRSEDSPFQAPQERFEVDDSAALDITDAQRRKIYAMRTKLLKAEAFSEDDWQQTLSARYGTENVVELTKGQASDLIERLTVIEEARQ